MKCVGYIRVSTEEQSSNGHSLGAQRAKLEAYAALYDLQLVSVIEDAGMSAKSLKRPGLQQALSMLKNKEADGLLIAKLDRLTRSISDWQTLIEQQFSDKRGKQLFSVADSIDTRTAAGRIVLNLLVTISQWEREVIAERTRDTLQHKIAKGERCGKIRYGFDLADDGATLTPNAQEQEAISFMRSLRAEGEAYMGIASKLNERGIPTKEGGKWIWTSVKRILSRSA
jgi:DNA invertase Pin-like site-specific DNA recombinase